MSSHHQQVDDLNVLGRLLERTRVLLLDFDGPICAVFADLPAAEVADQLREALTNHGHAERPPEIEASKDPFVIFRYASALGTQEAHLVEAALRAHEVEAVARAQPTPGSDELIHAWRATGRGLAIVSNNSRAAVNAYLDAHGLTNCIDLISARDEADPALLKPSHHLVARAITALGESPVRCTLLGDAVTDVTAAHAAHALAIGFANKQHKVDALAHAGAEAVVTQLHALTSTLLRCDL